MALGMKLLAVVWVLALAHGAQARKNQPCATSLAKCLPRGCAKPGTPDAVANVMKRRLASGSSPTKITFKVLSALQAELEKRFDGEYATLTRPDRARLRKFVAAGVPVGEGALVELEGFVASVPKGATRPHANTEESVNCRLTGAANNDFHISLTPEPNSTEFVGAVVEMIPQDRDESWVEKRLKLVQQAGLRVRVRGQLLLDNHHRVNDDPKNVLPGQPKRMSLWEVHPVQEFAVCAKGSCGEGGWVELAAWGDST